MKFGEKTRKVYSGDLVTDCVYLNSSPDGAYLYFWDIQSQAFRKAFYNEKGQLNGWKCSKNLIDLINNKTV